ncbi:gamma-glutamyl-gamma-aminobutyrate hydrolase family protein [Aeromicrobium chenweiae]|uniref:Gamma-glutamyl-gamma-aminobutyrate hydrolase n=1 Tax=Aeromicrobium chenweiae TaxID=2079793 RepID=A0A2S0WIK1_9ACTN|nr:gamma-glutamyl-gamma-aminobutyrate hydrolase family protein [Aeromicrobium chenweiae]AWB91137.1 gamma-glutamyl-gamma-aminobutyrate hydrolase [Aeromicrobium chenweiae]TGN31656.1 gamma-glutamyl-gamma-aminobutyrate hydrolase family protein [Aeromicrobium chenweiae]
MTCPVIGITSYRETARWGVWDKPADLLPAAYARAVSEAGAVAVILPPGRAEDAATVVHRLDGLVLAGGADIDPRRYGEQVHERTAGWRADRDAWETALLDASDVEDLPVLGICRGMQLMAVRDGGTLHQHVPDLVGHEEHSPGGAHFGVTSVDVVPGTRLAAAVGDKGDVRCHHHQAVAAHPGFEPVARSADGILEGMERPDRAFWVGVQWHPETLEDVGLFRSLVAAASRVTPRRTGPSPSPPGP